MASAPSPVATLDHRRADTAFQQIAILTGKGEDEVLQDEARLATDALIAHTPPFRSFGRKGGAKSAGDRRAIRDVETSLTVATDLGVIKNPTNERLGDRLKKLVRTEDRVAIEAILPNIGLSRYSGNLFPAHPYGSHQVTRDPRTGRRRQGGKRFLVKSSRGLSDAKRRTLARVGSAKAGWNAAAVRFGVNVPAFVRRHRGQGSVNVRLSDADTKGISIVNRVSHAAEHGVELRIVGVVERKRAGAMRKRVETLIRVTAKQQERIAHR